MTANAVASHTRRAAAREPQRAPPPLAPRPRSLVRPASVDPPSSEEDEDGDDNEGDEEEDAEESEEEEAEIPSICKTRDEDLYMEDRYHGRYQRHHWCYLGCRSGRHQMRRDPKVGC